MHDSSPQHRGVLPNARRREAIDRMDRILERAAKNMANVSDDEFEEALAEAMQAIRMRASWRVR